MNIFSVNQFGYTEEAMGQLMPLPGVTLQTH